MAGDSLEDGTPLAITITAADGPGRGRRGKVIVWDPRTGRQHATLAGDTQPVNAVACTRLEDGTPSPSPAPAAPPAASAR